MPMGMLDNITCYLDDIVTIDNKVDVLVVHPCEYPVPIGCLIQRYGAYAVGGLRLREGIVLVTLEDNYVPIAIVDVVVGG